MNKISRGKKTLWKIASGIMIFLLIAVCVFGFMRYYRILNDSLQDERALYVDELTAQLTRSITTKREWLISRVGSSASAFNQSDAKSFSDAERLFAYKKSENYTVLLVSDDGTSYTLDGRTAQIRNHSILTSTLEHDVAQFCFEKSSNGVDYWVFSSAVTPKTLDGISIAAIYEIYDVDQFHDDLMLSVFGESGYTYIIDLNGGVQLGPRKSADFIGYNLIRSLEKAGIDDASADKIASDVKEKKAGRLFAGFNGTDWAVQYAPLADSDEMAVVFAPIAETSGETTRALRYTLACIAGLVFGLALLVLSIVISNARATKERNRQMYELEMKNRVAATKNDFLAKMSHDIRTPLNAIIGMNYIAKTQIDNPEEASDCLRQIDISAKYLLGILNDILDMSKIESGKMELRSEVFAAQELVDTIAGISQNQARDKGVDYRIHVDERLSDAYIGDKQRLAQILMNLTNNAVKFTDRGGRIDVEFSVAERTENRDRLHIIVSDTGIGMTDEFMQNLFDPFAQDTSAGSYSSGGSGLGLSIVKSFVDMMGGTINVTSKKNEGSSFDVAIELERASTSELAVKHSFSEADDSVLEGKRVLLVEDNDINLIIATKIIEQFRVVVEPTKDGLAALDKFRNSDAHF